MLWVLFSTIAMLGTAGMPLLHQHFKHNSVAMLFWMRLSVLLFLFLPVFFIGFPIDPRFYIGVSLIALLASISDVFYYNAVKQHGAGVVTRLLPASAIGTFFLWFAFDPGLVSKYLATPVHTGLVFLCLCFGAWCASRLRHDLVSRTAVRDLWFVIVSAIVIPISTKLILGYADQAVAPLAYALVQSFCLTFGYLVYQLKTRCVHHHIFFSRRSALIGAFMSSAWMISVVGKNYAIQLVENPAYVSMILFTAPFFISLYERAMGHPDDSDRMAGLGLVLAAGAIIFLQLK